ncbi:MAG: multicopper oxidase family protein, partial [Mycoplasmatales bacterium]
MKYIKRKILFISTASTVVLVGLIGLLVILSSTTSIKDSIDLEGAEFKPNPDYQVVNKQLVITNDEERFYINQQIIPDPIRVPVNTQLNVEVQNKTSYAISLHFHGVLGMNKMDGVGNITQESIKPQESFTYQFNLDRVGTYMYHSHVDSLNQVNNAFLFGGLVVEDEIMQAATNKEMLMINTQNDDNTIYINNQEHLEYLLNNNEDIYLNIVNISSSPITLYFGEDIEWEILNLDANATTSQVYQNQELYLPTANRIDVKIKNPHKSFVLYTTLDDTYNAEVGFKITKNLDYTSEKAKYFTDISDLEGFKHQKLLYLYDIVTSKESVKEQEPDKEFNLELGMNHMQWTINNEAYPNNTTLDVDEGDIITINLVSNSSNSPHPFHLHGHEFSVIKVNDQKVNKSLLLDTVEVLPDEKVTIQFTANNPGIWAFHCHDLEHAARG